MIRQRGMAMLSAVAMAVLVTTMVSSMAWQFYLWIHQINNQRDLAQAKALAYAAIDFARLVIHADTQTSPHVDHRDEAWHKAISHYPVTHGHLSGRIHDLQGRFNLNNLLHDARQGNKVETAILRRLFVQLGYAPNLGDALFDWLNGNRSSPHRPNAGAHDDWPRSRTAKQPLNDLSELLSIPGFTPELLQALSPHVAVLPEYSAINVNFASVELLSAVTGLSHNALQPLLQHRQHQAFRNLDEIRSLLPETPLSSQGMNLLQWRSRYFLADVRAHAGRVDVNYEALLARQHGAIPQIVWLRRR